MKLPFPDFLLKTDIEITLEEMTPDGIVEGSTKKTKCILDEKSKTILTADKRLITLSAKAVLKGDISPLRDITGVTTINGVTRRIAASRRPRNPDGTVFSTELDLE